MIVRIFDSELQAAQATATLIAAQLIQKPNSTLGLATGSTPIPVYEELIRMYEVGVIDFSNVATYNLDEYVGISETHPCSYHYFMQEMLFSKINIKRENTHLPHGNASDVQAACCEYERMVNDIGQLDLQLLGIGNNGHIGFNEPAEHYVYECHSVALTEDTIQANRRFFSDKESVPKEAITLGIGGIMQANSVVLLATGKGKAEAVRQMLKGNISPRCQASVLRLHKNATILLDKAAATQL